MSDAAPQPFTPSPGVPNVAHQRFYEALSKETGQAPAVASTPMQQQTPQTAAYLASREPKAAAVAPKTGVTVGDIRAYQANRGKPAPKPYLDGTENNVKEFDAEMRATGQATGGDTVAAKERLIALKRSTPAAQRTHAWEAKWLADYAAADAGNAPIVPIGTSKPEASATNAPVYTKEVTAGVDFVMKNSNAEGMMVSHSIPKALLSGYTLPSGAKVHAETAIRMLRDARADGVSQAVVDLYVKGLKK